MKLNGKDIQEGTVAMLKLVGGGNRLAPLPALRAYRIKEALVKAARGLEEYRVQLITDRKGVANHEADRYDFPDPGSDAEVNKLYAEALDEERELELETLTLAEIESGHYRTEGGKKEPGLDISPEQLGVLVRLGVVVMPTE